MMNSAEIIPTIILCVLLIVLIYGAYKAFQNNVVYETEVVTSEDDPQLRFIAECRQSFVDHIVREFTMRWGVAPDDKRLVARIDSTSFDTNLASFAYNFHELRLYCDWKHNKIKVAYTYKAPNISLHNEKCFKIKANFLDFYKVDMFAQDCADMVFTALNREDDETVVACISVAKQMDQTLDDEAILQGLFRAVEQWEFPDDSDVRAYKASLGAYTQIMAYILKHHEQQFVEFLKIAQAEIDPTVEKDIDENSEKEVA